MEKCKIFVSHSLDEKEKIDNMKIFSNENFSFYFAEDSYSTKTISKKITNAIDSCDYFFLILTKKSQKSPFVNQEVGYAKARGKEIIIIKESPSIKQEGFLYGYDGLDASDDLIVEKITTVLKTKIDVNKISKSSMNEVARNDYFIQPNHVIAYQKEDDTKEILIVVGAILVLLLIIALAKKKS